MKDLLGKISLRYVVVIGKNLDLTLKRENMAKILEQENTRIEMNKMGKEQGIVCLENRGEQPRSRGRYLPTGLD